MWLTAAACRVPKPPKFTDHNPQEAAAAAEEQPKSSIYKDVAHSAAAKNAN